MPWRYWAGAAALLALGAPAQAQIGLSLNRVGSGARAAGMGDAFIAISDDGTAVSWNPAGLAQLRQPEFSLVYQVADRGLEITGLRSRDDLVAYTNQEYQYSKGSLEFASAALPFAIARKPVTVQAGWHRLYQLSGLFAADFDRYLTAQPDVPPTRVSSDDNTLGEIDVFSFAGAVKLSRHALLGGSFDLWRGDWTERISLVEQTTPQGSSAFYTNNSRQRLEGHNFTVGFLLTHASWNLGLVYHSPFWSDFHIEGQIRSSEAPAVEADIPARFRLPQSIGAGVAWRMASRWTVALSLTHDEWTEGLLDDLSDEAGPVSFFDGLPPALSTTRDTVGVNLGVEHLFLREGSVVPLRFGAGWEPQGAMDPVTRDPVDYVLLSVGGGYNTNRFKLDAAVQYRVSGFDQSRALTVDSWLAGGLARDALGRAATHEWRLKFSVIYRLADTDKLRSVFGKIFG
jgi:long-chain fatty acid transport protein